MSNIAIITARGGSKRIPKKNIKEFCGKPIIAYSIEAALNSGLFDEVMVSTDSEEIAGVAREYGAKVPFMRSAETSDDYAATIDVLLEVLDRYEESGLLFDTVCCIYPAAPFVTSAILKRADALLIESKADSVVPVVKFSSPPQKSFKIKDSKLVICYPDNMRMRSQDLEPLYHDCGQFYYCVTKTIRQRKSLVTSNTVALVISEMEEQDIDNDADWKMAEMKFRLMKGQD